MCIMFFVLIYIFQWKECYRALSKLEMSNYYYIFSCKKVVNTSRFVVDQTLESVQTNSPFFPMFGLCKALC